jgi:hypothetical protein
MIVTRSSSDVQRKMNPPREPGRFVWMTGYIGKHGGAAIPAADAANDVLFPDAYIVEQGPHVSGPPHFHLQNEFQVVMTGAGLLGRTPVRPYYVHYAGAYSPYGPIDAGPEGLSYFTLRNRYDAGAINMPENREQLRAGKRKPRARSSDVALGAARTIIAPEPDGLAALLYHVPAGESVAALDPATGGGQFWIVLEGELRAGDGALLPRHSCAFVSPDEPSPRIASSPAHALDVLLVQFPLAATA